MELLWIRDVILLCILIIITLTDLKRQEIDNEPIILGLVFISLFSISGFNNVSTLESVIGFLLGGTVFFILAFWGMGGGDIKLIAMIGFFLGWQYTLLVMYLSFIIGAIIGIWYVVSKGWGLKKQMPFGPSIALATIIALVYGEKILAYYSALLS